MTLKEMKLKENGNYVDMEVFYLNNSKDVSYHTDKIKSCDDYEDNMTIIDYRLMNEQEYNDTVLANSCIEADFQDWYGKTDCKILVAIVSPMYKIEQTENLIVD